MMLKYYMNSFFGKLDLRIQQYDLLMLGKHSNRMNLLSILKNWKVWLWIKRLKIITIKKLSYQESSGTSIQVAYNPEFIAQGEIVKGLEESDIVLIGTEYNELSNDLIQIYNKIQTTPVNAHVMSCKAAEVTKIGINCYLTTKISYANMMGEILIKSELRDEIDSVLNAVGGDSRVGKKYLKYGFGFGGPCLPRDNRALSNYAKKYNAKSKLSELVDEMNIDHTEYLATHYINKNPNKKIPFVMKHISYKKGTDILTDSQQYNLCLRLLSEGYTVFVQEIDAVINQFKLKDMSEIGDRLKFFKNNTKPEGYLIDL